MFQKGFILRHLLLKIKTMAAIDIINNMSNGELVKYYEYCMVRRYEDLSRRMCNVSYHPSFKMCMIYIKEGNKIYTLHYPNEMFLLQKMWNRFINGTFVEQCWWTSKNVFKTNISFYSKIGNDVMKNKEGIKRDKEILEYNGSAFEFISSGTKRKVYLSPCKKYVIKIAKEPYTLGLEENRTEAEVYKNNPDSIYAKCELIENGWLKMEYVNPAFFKKGDEYPDWTLNIAEHQVGYNLNGKLVAYDYGSTI